MSWIGVWLALFLGWIVIIKKQKDIWLGQTVMLASVSTLSAWLISLGRW